MEIALLLVVLSGFAILVDALLLYAILIRHIATIEISLFLTVGFLCASANLYALHSGTPYSAGLACLLGGIWCTQRRGDNGHMRSVVLAGVLGGLAVAFWLPYAVSLPALLCWALVNRQHRRFEVAVVLTLTTALTGAFLFGLAAYFAGVTSVADFRLWVMASGHGVKQTHNLIRSIVGFPKSFLELGQFGIRMKQFIFKDPYARVGIGQLFGQTIWKIGLFYIALLGLFSLRRTAEGKRDLGVLGVALIATMALAVAYEGGSPERYLPIYPFLFISVALCLRSDETQRIARIPVYLLFLLMIAGNVYASRATRIHAEQDKAVQRLNPLLPLPPRSLLFVVGDDSVANLYSNAPFSEIHRRASFALTGIYLPMMNGASWKQEFANTVLGVWKQGGSIWVTARVWSEQPRREWNWVEGDDPNVTWKDIVKFFRPLDHTSDNKVEDGFVMLTRSAENEAILQSYANKD